MAIYYKSDCVDCGFPCIGTACPYYCCMYLKCDNCNHTVDDLYELDNDDVCRDCYDKAIQKELYEAYKKEWCKQRNVSLKDIDEEIGVDGCCYVCFEEFLQNEYYDDEFIEFLAKEYEIILEPDAKIF